MREAVCARSAPSRPQAEKLPASAGTTIVSTSSSSAISVPKSGPAPPNTTSAASRGSRPCSTVMLRIASAIAAAAMCSVPRATSAAESNPRRPASGAQRRLRAIARELDAARELDRQHPEHDGRVGDRRLGAAAPVAGGARNRPGALRTDVQQAACADVRDRPSARADRADVDPRRLDRKADDAALVEHRHLAVADQAGVEARAADVGCDRARRARAGARARPSRRRPRRGPR